jgi:hypothetical protein
MRIFLILLLTIVSIIEIGPIPMTPLLLLWVVIFRPAWFYDLVARVYQKK